MTRREYLMAELRCASLRARLQVQDIDAVGGLIEPEQALELLADCDCLQFISPDNKNNANETTTTSQGV